MNVRHVGPMRHFISMRHARDDLRRLVFAGGRDRGVQNFSTLIDMSESKLGLTSFLSCQSCAGNYEDRN
jgi:hypothetical protein